MRQRSHSHSILITLATLLAGLAPAALAASSPPADHSVPIPGLQGEATLWWDGNGIAHIEADNLADAFALQGYAAASTRLFQLDHARKVPAGRTAELMGRGNVMVDMVLRRLQLWRTANAFIQGGSAETIELYQSFANGVNTYLDRARAGEVSLPPEYADLLLDADDIEDWRIEDSALAGALVLFGLSAPLLPELLTGLPRQLLLSDVAADLTRVAPAAQTPVIYPDESAGLTGGGPGAVETVAGAEVETAAASAAAAALTEMQSRLDPAWMTQLMTQLQEAFQTAGIWNMIRYGESNNWVVAPELTASGHALLCNDPHLDPQAYNQVFLVRIVTPEGNFTGGNFAALPGILFGHNDQHAMGFTALYADNLDLFHEVVPIPGYVQHAGTLVPIQRTHETYLANLDGNLVDMTFNVPDPDTYWIPQHGPILGWGPLRLDALSFKWTGHRPGDEVDAILDLMLATDFDAYRDAEERREVTAANGVYADIDGRIHYSAHLRYPKRSWPTLAPPWWILPGGGFFDWKGQLPASAQPELTDPARGWIATANNDPLGLCFDNKPLNEKTYHGISYGPGFRAERIATLLDSLAAAGPLTPLHMGLIQRDGRWSMAARFVPHLLAAAEERPDLVSGPTAEAIDRLRDWKFTTGVERVEPSIFQAWFGHFCETVLSDDLGPLYDLFVDPGMASRGLLYVLENPGESATGERLFDDSRTLFKEETRAEAAISAMDQAIVTLADLFGTSDQSAWKWGEVHGFTLKHPMGGSYNLPPEGSEPTRGYPRRGAAYTVNVASTGVDPADHTCQHQAVARFIAELDPAGIRSWWILDSGNGGPDSDHWGDMVDDYVAQRYVQITDDRDQQEGAAVHFVPRS
jgi:penicillin amidase